MTKLVKAVIIVKRGGSTLCHLCDMRIDVIRGINALARAHVLVAKKRGGYEGLGGIPSCNRGLHRVRIPVSLGQKS